MIKKYAGLAVVCLGLAALLPGFALANNRDGNYNDYRGDHYDNHYSDFNFGGSYNNRYANYDNYSNYRGDYAVDGYRRKNAAAYPDYVPTNNYYGNYNYNYGYNYNRPCNYPVVQNYNYNPAVGATNYTNVAAANCGYQNQYYYSANNGGCRVVNYNGANYYGNDNSYLWRTVTCGDQYYRN